MGRRIKKCRADEACYLIKRCTDVEQGVGALFKELEEVEEEKLRENFLTILKWQGWGEKDDREGVFIPGCRERIDYRA